MKLTEFPDTFEREIRSVSPAGAGWSVRFRCGHTVWFAIKPLKGHAYSCSMCFDEYLKAHYSCSMCFDEYLKAQRAVRPADKE